MTYYDLLKQYVSTGNSLSEHQLEKIYNLPNEFILTYFRSRMIALNNGDLLEEYEVGHLNKLNEKNKKKILNNLNSNGFINFFYKLRNPENFITFFNSEETNKYDFNLNDYNSDDTFDFLTNTNRPEIFIPYFKNQLISISELGFSQSGLHHITDIMRRSRRPEDFLPYFDFYYSKMDNHNKIMIILNSKNTEMFIPYLNESDYNYLGCDVIGYILRNTSKPLQLISFLDIVNKELHKCSKFYIESFLKDKNGEVYKSKLKEMGLI